MLQRLPPDDRLIQPAIRGARQAELGQFMTTPHVARFMASLFPAETGTVGHLLDAGAGRGALTRAFLDHWRGGGFAFQQLATTAYEVDETLHGELKAAVKGGKRAASRVIIGDYITIATADGLKDRRYTHAILNPPYKKIPSRSQHRAALRTVGIEAANLYAAFVALALAQALPGGQIVAIIPRSFCNGPYYRPFREFLLAHGAIHHIHLFGSRSKAFQDDGVLQENIIIRLERDGVQGPVTVTTSTDDSLIDITTHEHPFARIVFPDDPERFIHVPGTLAKGALERAKEVRYALSDLGIQVSTGPVVDFRLKDHLRAMPERGTVPLVYPGHLTPRGPIWPMPAGRKPNAIVRNAETERWLYPNGFYCAVRRFSSKEEKRRVVASVVDPSVFGRHAKVGFENHLNLFHAKKQGLTEALARGLAVFLNTTAVDEHVRRFSGHTQINATDLKLMKYPSRAALEQLGAWAMTQTCPSQAQIDAAFKAKVR